MGRPFNAEFIMIHVVRLQVGHVEEYCIEINKSGTSSLHKERKNKVGVALHQGLLCIYVHYCTVALISSYFDLNLLVGENYFLSFRLN